MENLSDQMNNKISNFQNEYNSKLLNINSLSQYPSNNNRQADLPKIQVDDKLELVSAENHTSDPIKEKVEQKEEKIEVKNKSIDDLEEEKNIKPVESTTKEEKEPIKIEIVEERKPEIPSIGETHNVQELVYQIPDYLPTREEIELFRKAQENLDDMMKQVDERLELMRVSLNTLNQRDSSILEIKQIKQQMVKMRSDFEDVSEQLLNLIKKVDRMEKLTVNMKDGANSSLDMSSPVINQLKEQNSIMRSQINTLQNDILTQQKEKDEELKTLKEQMNLLMEENNKIKQKMSDDSMMKDAELKNANILINRTNSLIQDLKEPIDRKIRNLENETSSLLIELNRQQEQNRNILGEYISLLEEKKLEAIRTLGMSNSRSRAILTKRELSQTPEAVYESNRLKQDNALLRAKISTPKDRELYSSNNSNSILNRRSNTASMPIIRQSGKNSASSTTL